ncbi:MAG: cytochrome c3 family protein [Planctomycetota bacterium]|jgi:predicted CXXCH cytochrome family protein
MVKKLGKGVSLRLVFGVPSVWLLISAYSCSGPPTDSSHTNAGGSDGQIDALGANAACYVCHIGFVKEQISKVHLGKDIGCIDCHGLSAPHANDENIGATPPDIMFERDEVDTMCLKCHSRHEISAEELAKYQSHPVCTDCHGSHRLDDSAS